MHAGWTDPILAAALGAGKPASQVRLAFAWPNATAPMDIFGKNTSQLSHKDDLLIFETNVTTGNTAAQDIPQQVSGLSSPQQTQTEPSEHCRERTHVI